MEKIVFCYNNFCFFAFHRRLITDSKVKLKYQHLITNSFVEVSVLFEVFNGFRVCFAHVPNQRSEACL